VSGTSSYSWRGGSPQFIRKFRDDFGPQAQIEVLRKSFRCHKHILEGSISIVKRFDAERLSKNEFEYHGEEGPKVAIHNTASDQQEAAIVRSIVERALPSLDVLILLPHRGFARLVSQQLRYSGINFTAPLTLPGEGLPLIAILSKWLRNTHDSLAFREILEAFIDNPSTGIPSREVRTQEKKEQRKAEFKKVSFLWELVIKKSTRSLWDSVGRNKENDRLYSLIFSAFSDLIALGQETNDPASFVAKVINTIVPWKKTQDFLEEIDTWVDASGQWSSLSRGSDVQLMTLQGAKGLEAKVVCVIGLEEGILPRADSSEKELAEQSRLIFVSMTRASEEVHLFHARKRSGSLLFRSPYKKGAKPDIPKSRFLNIIPKEHREERYHSIGERGRAQSEGKTGMV